MLDGISAEALEEEPGYVKVRWRADDGMVTRRRLSVFEVALLQRELAVARQEAQAIRERGRQQLKHQARRRAHLEFGRGVSA